MKITREFLEAIPKTDLHVHLDGSLRLGTLIELAKEQGVKLPSYTEDGLKTLLFKERYSGLAEYLEPFRFTTAVMQTPEAIERVAYELALDCAAEGVRYVEPRFAPQLHAGPKLSAVEALASANRGLARAKAEIDARRGTPEGTPPFEYGIIGCAMRMFTALHSSHYGELLKLHPRMPQGELFGLAAGDLARALIEARDERGLPIAGFDLAGAEAGYPAEDFRAAFDLAHKHFLKKTVHAGEAYGPASIFQAIADCHADRIGHGTHLFDEGAVELPSPEERRRYVTRLWQYLADRRTCIEVCLTSNLQTMPGMKRMDGHPFARMLECRLSVAICTDNRLVSRTTVTDEMELAARSFAISPRRLKDIVIYGFKRSFYPGGYMAKRAYIRKAIDFYEGVEKRFGLTSP